MMKRIALIIVFVSVVAGCAQKAPPSLSPAGVKIWQANEALLVLDVLQKSAIGLNGIERCQAPPNETICAPILSNANTRIVIDAVTEGVNTIRKIPDGWRATTSTALGVVAARLDDAGKRELAAYIKGANEIFQSIGGSR